MHSIELERISHAGAPSDDGLRRRQGAQRRAAPERRPPAGLRGRHRREAPQTIVCGAPNVAAGQTVAVVTARRAHARRREAEEGQAPRDRVERDDPLRAGARDRRGPRRDHRVLDTEAGPAGTPLSEVFPVSEPVIELEPTSNRVDCFGVYGVARELHAVTGAELAPPPWDGDAEATGEGTVDDYASVTVEVPRRCCPRFSARVFTDVKIGPSPPWLKARLTAAGMRPINNVVDITNYVMLMTAQPLHAFDLDKVPGGEIIVRTARDGEKMTTLDGTERTFDAETVLVCDRDGPDGHRRDHGRPGLRGQRLTTTRVLLEVATWNGVNILRTSRKLGAALRRLEPQREAAAPGAGAARASGSPSKLMVELCGARLVPGTIDVTGEIPDAHRLRLRQRPRRAAARARDPARRPGHLPAPARVRGRSVDGDDLEATVPSSPPLRRHPRGRPGRGGRAHPRLRRPSARRRCRRRPRAASLSREQRLRRRAEDLARDLGFDGVVTLSLTDSGRARAAADRAATIRARQTIAISNPLSSEHSVLRTTLLGGLLDVARYNLAHGAGGVALYESGRAYLREGEPIGDGTLGGSFPGERAGARVRAVAARLPGERAAARRGAGAASDARARLLRAQGRARGNRRRARLRGRGRARHRAVPQPRAAPAACSSTASRAGWIGEIHPLVCRAWDLDAAAGFEVDLAPPGRRLADRRRAVRGRDHLPGGRAGHRGRRRRRGRGGAGARGRRRGRRRAAALDRRSSTSTAASRCGDGRKSLALRLEFRAADRTLTDEEVAAIRERIDGGAGRGARGVAACLSRRTAPGDRRRRLGLCRRARGRARAGAIRGLELVAATSRSEAGKRLDELYPRYRVPDRAHRARPRRCSRRSTPRSSPTRTGPRRRWSPRCGGMGLSVVDLSADFRLVDAAIYERWYAPHGEPELLDNAVYGLTELDRDAISDRRARRQPGLLSDRGAAGARAAGRARADRVGRDRRQVGRLGRRAATAASASRWSTSPRTSCPTRSTATATCRRSNRSSPRLGVRPLDVAGHVCPAFAANRPGAAGELLRGGVRPLNERCGAVRRALCRRARSSRSSIRRPGCATSATPTSAGSMRRRSARTGSSSSRRSTTSGRAPPGRRSRTST